MIPRRGIEPLSRGWEPRILTNYTNAAKIYMYIRIWNIIYTYCTIRGSNPGPSVHKTSALPTAPMVLTFKYAYVYTSRDETYKFGCVHNVGIEPTTLGLWDLRAANCANRAGMSRYQNYCDTHRLDRTDTKINSIDWRGSSGNRTHDLSHPKRESCH